MVTVVLVLLVVVVGGLVVSPVVFVVVMLLAIMGIVVPVVVVVFVGIFGLFSHCGHLAQCTVEKRRIDNGISLTTMISLLIISKFVQAYDQMGIK